jgi:MFS family permease
MTETTAAGYTPTQRESIYRRNFFLMMMDGILFTIAMNVLGTTTVIPDFIRRLTDSEILIGMSSSLFEMGWMLPQLFMARYLMRVNNKKWWFAGPNIPVRMAILIYSGVIVLLGEGRPTAILIGFLIAYGIAALGDGVVGVPWVDLIGSSLDDKWRARMFGMMTAIAGVIMLGVAPIVGVILGADGPAFPNNYALVFAFAGVLWVFSILPPLFLKELPGGKAAESAPSLREYIPELGRVLREDGPFRAMAITRVLTSLFGMASPFYIGFATEQLGLSSETAVPTLLAMQTAGTISGALLYSWMGARRNLAYIRLALVCAAIWPISALLAGVVGPAPLYVGFFTAGVALSNLFGGYLTWVIQHTHPDQRPTYTGLFNTIAAITLLITPILGGSIVQALGYQAVFGVALVMVLSALFVVARYIRDPQRTAVSG